MKNMLKGERTTTKDVLVKWNEYYSNNVFAIGIKCVKCEQWRKVFQYQESSEVPDNWDCSMWQRKNKKPGSCDIPSDVTAEDFGDEEFTPGSLVWAKLSGYPCWPGMVEDCPDKLEYFISYVEGDEYHINFFADRPMRSWVPAKRVTDFRKPSPDEKLKKKKPNKALDRSIMEAEKALKMPLKERLGTYSFAVRYKGKWGKTKASARLPSSKNSAVNLKQVKGDKEETGGRKRRRGSKINDPKKKGVNTRNSSNSKAPEVNAPENTTVQNSFEDSDKYSSEVEMSVADEDDPRIGQISDDDDDDDITSSDSESLREYTEAESDYIKTLERVFRPSYMSNKRVSPYDSERCLRKFLKEAESLNNDPEKIRLIDMNKYIE
ncbi:zinc finger CW-type PWWP domain protein 1 [Trichonephila inaurata madagascariensis]|uniref:Zinc finger CW-type PWWP domain protein 1 n=1 Tax=Trichonephila inaurata madagascariensis TaxID=2747483 RepID=A0A8X6YK30_9ARAC|nr:zinc finger CW-type PWWP domain protein 1 [Trichonephila inaurata madagascariensis]